jgi:hypothetical protein
MAAASLPVPSRITSNTGTLCDELIGKHDEKVRLKGWKN